MSVDVSDHNKDVPTYGDVADVRVSWEICTLSTRCSSVVKKIQPITAAQQRTNTLTNLQRSTRLLHPSLSLSYKLKPTPNKNAEAAASCSCHDVILQQVVAHKCTDSKTQRPVWNKDKGES